MEVGMRYKMILGQTLFSFFKKEKQGLRIREVRFMNRDMDGAVNGTTRLLYDEDSGTLQRYVNGSAPIASLSDDMVCFLAEVSRCFGRLSGEQSWEKDVWLCVDTEVIPENSAGDSAPDGDDDRPDQDEFLPIIAEPGMGYNLGLS
jgi:hypothetical protein